MVFPSREQFLDQCASGMLVPVWSDLLADVETPLSAYWKLAHDETYSFLLESVTGGEQLARYSILGVRPRLVIRTKGSRVSHETPAARLETSLADGQDPLDVLKGAMRPGLAVPGLPKFHGGAVGMLGYDLVRFFERLPDSCEDDLAVDDMAMMLCDEVAVFDHAKNTLRLIVNAEPTEAAYDAAVARLSEMRERLAAPRPPLPEGSWPTHPVTSNVEREVFEANVSRVIDYIAEGDGIQMVLSQRFETRVDAHPLSVYRALRALNPSPYMFLLRFGDMDVVGASPEILVSLNRQEARVRPIAGTRMRGATEIEDEALAAELLADEKERAEHIMLVDLGRNDLGRVCETGSVKVGHLMEVERYSHVMHIVSDVRGTLAEGHDGFDLVRATFPAGTVSGAPKVRAMQIIDELETTRRGLYAGSAGYFGYDGDLDLCIAIRTILIKDGKAYVQAGAGIVYDSIPASEFAETENKARACLRAIELAQRGDFL